MKEIQMEHGHPDTGRKNSKISFQKKYYTSLRIFWKDLQYLLYRRMNITKVMRENQISPAFRERLMMTVTQINNCRYCRAFHIEQSIRVGISEEEIQLHLSGLIPDDIPKNQKLALAYARSWAKSDAKPELELHEQIREAFGDDGLESIELVLRMISMGNMLGNTWDYFLYRITFGRRGA